MSPAKGNGRPGAGPGRKTGFRLGIRGRLLGAFAATASLTLVASGVALLSYASIDDSFRRIAQDSVPAMSEALVLARQGAEFSGLTGSLVAAKDQAALKTVEGGGEPGFVSLEGYLVGRLVVAALGRIDGEPTHKAFLDAVAQGGFDLDGVKLDYKPGDNKGSDHVFLTVIQADGSFKPVTSLAQPNG